MTDAEIMIDSSGKYSDLQRAIIERQRLEREQNGLPDVYVDNTLTGFGDTVYNVIHAVGLDKLAEMYTAITGRPCNCGERRKMLNEMFPYGESNGV